MMPANQKMYRNNRVRTAADPVLGLGGRKLPAGWARSALSKVLRLRATSAVSRDKFVMALRSEAVTFLISLVVRGRKAPKSICPTSIAGVLRLRAINSLICDRSARRFAQDDAFLEGTGKHLVGSKKQNSDFYCLLLS